MLGGGPGGAAAASMLARGSHRVLLVTPEHPPSAALAESVPPSARKLLLELGMLEAVEAAGLERNTGNTVWWAGQPARSEEFDGEHGFHVDKSALERALLPAVEEVGVEVRRAKARSAEEHADGWTVRCEEPTGSSFDVSAAWLLDATGRHGVVARHEGRVRDVDNTTLALVSRWRRDDGWGEAVVGRTLVESHPDGWAWSVPLAPDTRCVTAMVDQRVERPAGEDASALMARALGATREVGELVRSATPVGEPWTCTAALYHARRHARRRLLLVGDAGSFIDPLSSYGVKKALSSGWLAGIAVHTALMSETMADTAVAFFDEREHAVYRRYRRASARFFAEAADAYGSHFWTRRAEAADREGGAPVVAGVDPDALGPTVPEAEVREAFDEIRSRPLMTATRGSAVRPVERPSVVGHRIELVRHLASDRYPDGLRYVNGVDLEVLAEIAPAHPEVADGWTAYNDAAPVVTLPDYLTALATAFAAGLLEHRDD